jgi:hypothetical protein
MTMPEQASKVATSTIDALKGNPGLLVLVLMQIITLGVLFFVTDKQNTRRAEREMYLLQHCLPTRTDFLTEIPQ